FNSLYLLNASIVFNASPLQPARLPRLFNSSKEQGGKTVQVMTPDWPRVPAWMFGVGILYSHLVELCHHNLAVFISNVFLPSHGNPELFQIAVDGGHVVLHERVLRVGDHGLIAPPS